MLKIIRNGIRGHSGFTVAEMVISLCVTCILFLASAELFVDSSRMTDKITTQSKADSDIALAVEKVRFRLNEARYWTIDTNGLGISYRLPTKNRDGTYTSSTFAMDSIDRRIYVRNGCLWYSDSDTTIPLLKYIPAIDPSTGTTLVVFKQGMNTKQISVRLVTAQSTQKNVIINASTTTVVQPKDM